MPRAETEAPREAQGFWVPNPMADDFCTGYIWANTNHQREWHSRGLVYLTAEDAAARGRAMVETEVGE